MSLTSSPIGPPNLSRAREGSARRFLRSAWELVKVVLVSAVVIVPLRAYVVRPFIVRGDSMVPTFENGEYLFIDEASYTFGIRPPKRGDVVVFQYPLDPSQYYIKRVVAVPGEKVEIVGGIVRVISSDFPRGVTLDESSYLPRTERTDGTLQVTLKDGEIFVLGDNRDASSDSRAWGPLARQLVVGRAWIRAFPLRRAGVVAAPRYGSLPPFRASGSPSAAAAAAPP